MRPAGQRDICAIVHQNLGCMRIRKRKHAADKMRKFSRSQIFFANLDTLNSRRELSRDIFDKRFDATQRFSIGDVVTKHYSRV